MQRGRLEKGERACLSHEQYERDESVLAEIDRGCVRRGFGHDGGRMLESRGDRGNTRFARGVGVIAWKW